MKVRCEAKWKGMKCAIDGEVRRTAGTFPNVATIRIPSTTFDAWNYGSEQANKGDLVLTTTLAGKHDLTIEDLYAHDVAWLEEYAGTTRTGRFVATVTLKDRRFLWEFGHVTGTWNVPTEDGKGVVTGTSRSLAKLIGDCLEALGESSISIPQGGDNDPPDGPHVEWAFESARSELERLLEYAGYVLVLMLEGKVKIYKVGEGQEPDFQPALRIPQTITTAPTWRPTRVIVTTAPRRIRNEIHPPEKWDAVGEESSGVLDPIDDLSYEPPGGWYKAAANGFEDMNEGESKTRALKCVLKWFRIPEKYKKYLPLLEDRCHVVEGVRAKPRVIANYSYFDRKTKKWQNRTGCPRINYSIDFKRGIIKFAQICAPVKDEGVARVEDTEYFSPYVTLGFSYELRDSDDPEKEYYRYVQGSSGRDQVVRLPTGTLYQINGNDQNKAQLDALAKKIADRILSRPLSVNKGPRAVFGYWPVDCNGLVSEVCWRDNFTTEYHLNEARPSLASHFQKRSMKRALAQAEMARDATLAEGAATSIGSRARAHHDPGESSFEIGMAPPAGFVKYEG